MTEPRPSVVILAGPNGAGKSTVAPELLQGELAIDDFVNADVIALGLSAFNPEGAAVSAGRIMLTRVRELASRRANFAFETTLSSRSFKPWIEKIRASGYEVHLFFLWLPSPELAVERVADRVRSGGHDVPPETIRRRYRAGLHNLFRLYLPIVSSGAIYDCSGPRSVLVAERLESSSASIYDQGRWTAVQEGAV
ncbi:MAG: zeta toxin family protein [Vicinamibacterales bacterium]